MKLSRTRPVLLGLLSFLAGATTWTVDARAVTLVYTNDVLGEIEPCGCRANPMGGMLRKAGLLETLKKEGENQFLQVDAGDFFFESTDIPDALRPQAKLQAEYLLRAHELLGHQVVVPGEKDFALGVPLFESLAKKSKVRFLAANLRWRGKLLLPPTAEFEFSARKEEKNGKKLKVGVIGIVGDQGYPPGFAIDDPVKECARLVARLKGKVDRIVVVSHQGYEKDLELAKKVAGIDVIVGGHTQSFIQSPERANGTLVVQSSYRNQHIGVLPIDRDRFPNAHDLAGLEEKYEQPPVIAMKKLVADFKSALAKLNAKAEAKLARETPASKNRKLQTFSQCLSCHEPQFDFWRNTNHAKALTPLAAGNQLKNLECLQCHTVGLLDKNGWKDLGHFASLKSGEEKTAPWLIEDVEPFMKQLTEAKTLDQPVKLKRDGAPLPAREALGQVHRAFGPVQCENCHGPAGDHPFTGSIARKPAQTACVTCHTVDRAPGWYKKGKLDQELFAKKLKSVACPAGES